MFIPPTTTHHYYALNAIDPSPTSKLQVPQVPKSQDQKRVLYQKDRSNNSTSKMQPGGDGGGGNLIRGGSRSRGGSFIRARGGDQSAVTDEAGGYSLGRNPSFARSRGGGGEHSAPIDQGYGGGNYGQSRGIGGRGMGSGEQSAAIDEGGGYSHGRNPSFARGRGGGGEYGGDLGSDTARQMPGPSTSQGYGFRVGGYSRGGEGTQHQQLPPTTGVRQQPFTQSRGYGGGPRGSQRQGFAGAHAQETAYNGPPVGIRKASNDQAANDEWARLNREAIERNKDVVPQETPIKPLEKVAAVEKTPEMDRTEQKQIPQQPPTSQQAPAPIRQPASEVPVTQEGTVGKSSFDLMRSVQQRVSVVPKPAPAEEFSVTRSTIQAPAPVTNASNAGGDIATTIRNAATDEQIEELGRLVDTLSQTFARMSVLVKSFKK